MKYLDMQISKKQVDSHCPESQTVPHCELVAKWLKMEQQVDKPLEHTINILGTAEDDNYFTINIDPPKIGKSCYFGGFWGGCLGLFVWVCLLVCCCWVCLLLLVVVAIVLVLLLFSRT